MKSIIMTTLCLVLGLGSSLATASDEQQALDRLRSELEQARLEVAEAAQEMARLQREFFEASGGALSESLGRHPIDGAEHAFEFEFDLDDGAHAVFSSFPPRLGVVLGEGEGGESNRIVGLTPGGGADQAGLRIDDRLLSVADQDVRERTSEQVRSVLGNHEAGDEIEVVVQRGEDRIRLPVVLGSSLDNIRLMADQMQMMNIMDEDQEREVIRIINATNAAVEAAPPVPPVPPLPGLLMGLGGDTDLISNHSGLASYFGTGDGVLVLRIDEDNPLNLLSGDVILEIDGDGIEEPMDVGRALLDLEPGGDIALRVFREGLETMLYGTVPTSSFRPPMGQRIRIRKAPEAPPSPPGPGARL
jgi:hypothetical protein